jgi:hypothetical protein
VHARRAGRAQRVFDLNFLNAAIARTDIKRNPFHPFSSFDTATLGGVAFGQTVLSRAIAAAGLEWDPNAAHSAIYDAERTAALFCIICNKFRFMYEEALNARPTSRPSTTPLPETAGGAIISGASAGKKENVRYQVFAVAPASSSSAFNSPFWNISVMMSEPPTSSR